MKTFDAAENGFSHVKRCPPRMMPFLYNVYEGQFGCDSYIKTIVKIAAFDMSTYDHLWWADESLTDRTVRVPDVDIVVETHEFIGKNGELNAIKFIQNWWATHPIDSQ